jgi:quinone-modifying oxidoreductase subunit QmoA
MTASIATNQTILVVGGGIAGMTAALEAAECGKQVILVEKSPRWAAVLPCFTAISPRCAFPPAGWKST